MCFSLGSDQTSLLNRRVIDQYVAGRFTFANTSCVDHQCAALMLLALVITQFSCGGM